MDVFFKKFERVDSRILYVLLVGVILTPLIKPLGLPIGASTETQAYYNTIEQLQSGEIVLMSCDYSPGADAELWPMTLASVRHVFAKGARIIGFATKAEGTMYVERALEIVTEEFPDKTYGTDYIIVPFISGEQNAVAAIAKDFRSMFPKDYYGNPASDLPLLSAVTKSSDLSLILSWCSSDALIWYPQQFEAPTKIKVAGGSTSVSLSGFMPYFASGQISGLLSGVRGAAEYEQLVGNPGEGTAIMDAQSLSHLLIMVFILLGNAAYFADRKPRKGRVQT